jgi:stage II sporulation protein P
MKNKFITKKNKSTKKYLLVIIIFLGTIIIIYKKLSNYKMNNLYLNNLLKTSTFTKSNIIEKLSFLSLNPLNEVNIDLNKYLSVKEIEKEEEDSLPKIYLYNTHQTETYTNSYIEDISINPTVIMNDYILENLFNENGYKTIVEENSVKDVLNNNNWKYSNSYKVTRIFLDEVKEKYPSLEYFIDIHRDSLGKSNTTIQIDDKSYAKVMFIIGLENPNYTENLKLVEEINSKLNSYYPNLSKGIYKKGGEGVNGVYNQDFDKNTILIEIGGYENTPTEVLNSTLAFGKCFLEVINE